MLTACNCCLAGMFGCGMAGSFQQLLAWRWVTGLGSALQMSGSQLCLADISRADNRSRCLGTNQACITVKVQTGTHNCDTPYLVLSTDMSYVGTSVLGDADTYQQIAPALAACSASNPSSTKHCFHACGGSLTMLHCMLHAAML